MRPRVLPLVLAVCGVAGLIAGFAGALTGCQEAASTPMTAEASSPDLLHGAMQRITEVMTHDIFSPPQASRVYAYTSVAGYEALAATRPDMAPLAGQLRDFEAPPRPEGEVHGPAAALYAMLAVGEAMTFSSEDLAEYRSAAEARLRAANLTESLRAASQAYGEAVAQHVLAWATADGYARTRSGQAYTVTDEAGTWRPTPPAYIDAVEPNWATLRPFVMDSAAQFKPPPPPPFSTAAGTAFRREIDGVYDAVNALTDEQRAIASFWDCNPYTMHTRGHAMFATKKITPGGHWMGIAAIASRQHGDDAAGAAEAYVRTSLALVDAFISTWDEKYRSRVIRPETVINEALDEDWEPVLQTPPFPEYPSGHSVVSGAAAEALTSLYGDGVAFVDTTEVAFGLPARSFPSFREAADEAAMSRLYGGIHYPMAIENGLVQGRSVGAFQVERLKTRVPAVAGARLPAQ